MGCNKLTLEHEESSVRPSTYWSIIEIYERVKSYSYLCSIPDGYYVKQTFFW